ncbi:hypothetical protein [Cobetia sp. 1CM21F]|uniref:hypothetical protein n=1 Tax=Cobetia sp. 1CM21F TaxID=2929163 RepID=UPI0020BE007A|nr:hypothetical protein [Cobetia sp. 1CM21F]MCK8069801.1 hypothetical protein [Cobetia sp. 1CM21F]
MTFDSNRSIRKLTNGASVMFSNRDWSEVTNTAVQMGGKAWPLGLGVGKAAGTLQTRALAVFTTTGEQLIKVHADMDLNQAAKDRRSVELLDQAAEALAGPYADLADAWSAAAVSAEKGFDPTQPLDMKDAVSAAQDVELRGIARALPANERSRLMADAASGKQPEITAAVLRGVPIASGLTADAFGQLKGAGIVAANRPALDTIRAMTFVSFETEQTVKAIAKSLMEVGKAGHHGALSKAVEGRTDAPMKAYLATLPMGA